MFISQVLFESEKENEPKLQSILAKKMGGVAGVPGLLSSECWRGETAKEVSYCFLNKWEGKEAFMAWMSGEKHDGRPRGGDASPIRKTAYQFESVTPEELAESTAKARSS